MSSGVPSRRAKRYGTDSTMLFGSVPVWQFGPDLAWQEDAACRQRQKEPVAVRATAERFFAEGPAPLDVRRQCAECPVREQCLRWALDNDEKGYWGGLSQAQRDKLRRETAA